MRNVAIAALLFTASPALASISEGEWFSENGTRVIFDGLNFQIWTGIAPEYWNKCQIIEWPIDTPVAQASCENGDTHTVEIHMDSVSLDGMELKQELEHEAMEGDGH